MHEVSTKEAIEATANKSQEYHEKGRYEAASTLIVANALYSLIYMLEKAHKPKKTKNKGD